MSADELSRTYRQNSTARLVINRLDAMFRIESKLRHLVLSNKEKISYTWTTWDADTAHPKEKIINLEAKAQCLVLDRLDKSLVLREQVGIHWKIVLSEIRFTQISGKTNYPLNTCISLS